MTEQDERPLLDFLCSSGGHLLRMFSPVWPPVPLVQAPKTCGDDECLGIWYPEVIPQHEFLLPDCRPDKGAHGCYELWELPLITFQRQWYFRKQCTIFAVELDYRSFRPGRPATAEFTAAEIGEFEQRLCLLHQRATMIRDWLAKHLRVVCANDPVFPDCFAGEEAWQESERLRRCDE